MPEGKAEHISRVLNGHQLLIAVSQAARLGYTLSSPTDMEPLPARSPHPSRPNYAVFFSLYFFSSLTVNVYGEIFKGNVHQIRTIFELNTNRTDKILFFNFMLHYCWNSGFSQPIFYFEFSLKILAVRSHTNARSSCFCLGRHVCKVCGQFNSKPEHQLLFWIAHMNRQ